MTKKEWKKRYGIDDEKWLNQQEKVIEAVIDKLCDDFESKKCVNCKKSTQVYNYMKKFIGYSCKDKLFKDNIDPFPKGFGCNKWKAKT